LARQVDSENIFSFHKTYFDVNKDAHTYLFLDLTYSFKYLLGFITMIFQDKIAEVFAPVDINEPVEFTATLSSRP
jgi:hypothetical protein